MKQLILLALLLPVMESWAQDGTIKDLKKDAEKTIKKDASDTSNRNWKKGGLFNLNINQGSLSNWSAGGENFSFSLNAFLNAFAFYKKGKNSWDNILDLAYGVVKTTSLGSRKASDRIDFTSKYGYALSKHLNLATLLNTRTQFARGFAYTKTAGGDDTALVTSKTLMPAYVLLSLGVDYKPNDNFSLFFSPATARWVIVADDLLAPLYGVAAGKNARHEVGAFASANYLQKIGENMNFKSKLDLFSNYKSNPENVDIFWTNVFTAKITRYINFSLNLDLIYDDDTQHVKPGKGPAPQILQLMGIGFAYNFNPKKI
ncbi:MAG: DUF3078 domain-containing protein [Chitinophagaceae bacterium]|nr:MAG: DUF3078 domain-containing protein [Chitinophagaceae bacterium]